VVRKRRLNEDEYRTLGRILAKAAEDERYTRTVDIIRLIAMSGCRRGEIIEVRKAEIDTVGSAFRFENTKEGQSVRPMGLPIVEYFDERNMHGDSPYVFPGERNTDGPFGSFPRHWEKIFAGTELADLTAHVLRHSFASMANDLGFTEITIAALLGHASDRSRAAMSIRSTQRSSWPPTRCRRLYPGATRWGRSRRTRTTRSIEARGRRH
jgi:integrase